MHLVKVETRKFSIRFKRQSEKPRHTNIYIYKTKTEILLMHRKLSKASEPRQILNKTRIRYNIAG
jgi:hypothetical protein